MEYRGDSNAWLVQYSNGPTIFDCQMVGICDGIRKLSFLLGFYKLYKVQISIGVLKPN